MDPFLESWTTMTWLAARFPSILPCRRVLGLGYHNPALTAKMAPTLQDLVGRIDSSSASAPDWRQEATTLTGYPNPEGRGPALRRSRGYPGSADLMWTENDPTSRASDSASRGPRRPPLPAPPPPILVDELRSAAHAPDDWATRRHVEYRSCRGELKGSDSQSATSFPRGGRRRQGERRRHYDYRDPRGTLPNRGSSYPAEWLETLSKSADLGVRHFVFDFGHIDFHEPCSASPRK